MNAYKYYQIEHGFLMILNFGQDHFYFFKIVAS